MLSHLGTKHLGDEIKRASRSDLVMLSETKHLACETRRYSRSNGNASFVSQILRCAQDDRQGAAQGYRRGAAQDDKQGASQGDNPGAAKDDKSRAHIWK